jgi:hypothetical protein
MIPKLIHQIWIGDNPLPRVWQDRPETWKQKNPEYVYKLWDNDSIKDIDDEGFLDLSINPTHLSDYFRYKILDKFGGYYVDVDFECLTPIDEWQLSLHEPILEFFGVCYCGIIQSGIIGACVNSRVCKELLKHCTKKQLEQGNVYGPEILTREVRAIMNTPYNMGNTNTNYLTNSYYEFFGELSKHRIITYNDWQFFPTWHGIGNDVTKHNKKLLLTRDENEYSCWYPDKKSPYDEPITEIEPIDDVFVLSITGAGHEERVKACLRNWLKYFKNYLFTTDTYTDPDINHIVTTNLTYNWHACPVKIFRGLQSILEKNNNCNWVLITDDDSFINPRNLGSFLKTINPEEKKVYGKDMTGWWHWKNTPVKFQSGHAHLIPMSVVKDIFNYIKENNWMPWLTSLSVLPQTLHGTTDSLEDLYPIQAQADVKLGWVLSEMGIEQVNEPNLFREEPPEHYQSEPKDILNRISYHRIYPDQQDKFQEIIETGVSKITH